MANLSIDYEVKKHVAAVHIQSKYTLLQKKLSNVLLANAFDQLQSEEEFDIAISDLGNIAGFNSNDRDYLKKNLIVLASTPVAWNILAEKFSDEDNTDTDPTWTVSPMFEHITLKGGRCSYSYNRRVKTRLTDPAVYAKFSLAVQRTFTSSYALSLYENCSRYKAIGKTRWFELDMFRKLMGVEEGQYSEFKALNRRVIKTAVNEVNLLTDIEVAPVFNRVNRKIVEIQFTVTRNPQFKLNLQQIGSVATEKESLISELVDLGVSEECARISAAKHSSTFIHQTINDVLQQKKEGKIRKSVAGFIYTILNDTPAQTVIASKPTKKPKTDNSQSTATKKNQATKRAKKAELDKQASIQTFLNGLTNEENTELTKEFEEFISTNEILKTHYKKQGLKSKIVEKTFYNFVDELCLQK